MVSIHAVVAAEAAASAKPDASGFPVRWASLARLLGVAWARLLGSRGLHLSQVGVRAAAHQEWSSSTYILRREAKPSAGRLAQRLSGPSSALRSAS